MSDEPMTRRIVCTQKEWDELRELRVAVRAERAEAEAQANDWKVEAAFLEDERDKAREERDQAYALLRLYVAHGKPPCQHPAPDGTRCCECIACHAYSLLPEALADD